MPIIRKVVLKNFRNYKNVLLENKKKHIAIFGCNGVGKTNFLESISLLSFFTSIKKAKMQNICYNSHSAIEDKYVNQWNAEFFIEHNDIQQNINISYTEDKKKAVYLNQKLLKNCSKEIDWMKIHWYTPSMLSFFNTEKNVRRRFLDMLVYIYCIDHANHCIKYEKLKNERLSLLIKGNSDERWIYKIEELMSEYASIIINNRVNTLEILNKKILNLSLFLVLPRFFIDGISEEFFLQNGDIDRLKIFYLDRLVSSREIDKISKRTSFGISNSDFKAINLLKEMVASESSTGEQKAMLISIIIASLIKNKSILLLDDISASLDKKTIECIKMYVNQEINAQIIFTDLINKHSIYHTENSIMNDTSVYICEDNKFSEL